MKSRGPPADLPAYPDPGPSRITPVEPLAYAAPPSAGPGADQENLFDWETIARYASFALHAVRRHKAMFVLIWASVIGASLLAMAVLPKTWHVETTLQAQRNQVISSLSNPNRGSPLIDADAPTRNSAETVLRHDNLVALVGQTDFLRKWPLNRAPLLRLKDRIWSVVAKPQTNEDRVEGFVGYLAGQFSVTTGEGTVTIGVDLPDPQLAFQLVETAQQNFLEARHASEVSSIAEAISILETRATQSYQAMVGSLQQLETLRAARKERLGRQTRRQPPPPAILPPAPANPELMQLAAEVQGKRRAVADLEEFRRRRILELQTRLQEQRAVYSESHPAVLDIQQSLEALQHDSPQLQALRLELASLEGQLKKKGGPALDGGAEVRRTTPVAVQAARLESDDPRESENPQIEYAKDQVRHQIAKYNGLVDRLEAARLELDTARAAFKFRYGVIQPARKPRAPVKPKPALILSASFLAGLALAVFAASWRDVQSKRLLERWQVEQWLQLPILVDFRSKAPPE